MDALQKSLGQLGLGAYESQVYAALLKQSPSGASWIAKKCGLSRSSVYTTLEALARKGLVGTTYKNEVKQFVAEGHSALVDVMRKEQQFAQKRTELAEQLRDQFALLTSGEANVPQVVFFEGQQGLKRIYLAMLRRASAGAVMRILRDEFVWQPTWAFVFEAPWRDKVRRIKIEKNISTQLLVNRSRAEREHTAYYRARKSLEHRVLPAAYPIRQFAMYLVDDIASILSVENNNLVGIQIVNRQLAANFVTLYASLWDKSSRR